MRTPSRSAGREAAIVQATRAEYEALAPAYDRRWRGYIAASLDKVLAALTLRGDERVLDVACGTGELERRLLARHPRLRVTALDLTPAMLLQAQQKMPGAGVAWVLADASRLPLADSAFDVAVCANSFHYFPRPLDSLRQMRRCLVPGGTLILVDWCDDYLMCKLCSLWQRWTDPAFYCMYTLDDCRAMMGHAGFDVLHAERFKVSWLWGMMLLRGVARPGVNAI
jgi:ubiquinone/menaquinone biosynthesis C-methylase UbiE